MLQRSYRAKLAKPVFFLEYNDIDVFIEDTAIGYKKIFTKLLNRILSDKFRIDTVFPLGGRNEVLRACENDQESRNRHRLYIIDGDLYLLSGEKINLKGLYTLNRYCIENFLICSDSLSRIMEEEDPDREIEQLNKIFNFSGWINDIKNDLLDLFIEYGIAKKITPEIKTVSYGYRPLVSDNSGLLDKVKVGNHIANIKQEIIAKVGDDLYAATKNEIKKHITYDIDSLIKFVSAKDLLMPLMFMRFSYIVKNHCNHLSLKHRLSNMVDIEELKSIKNYIYN